MKRVFALLFVVIRSVSSASAGESVRPAAVIVSTDSSAGYPLFDYEAIQLSEDSLKILSESTTTVSYAKLFGFESEGTTAISGPARTNASLCKTFPGDPTWPSNEAWAILNSLLGGALLRTTPVGAPCFKSSDSYDSTKCASLREQLEKVYAQ